MTFDVAGRNFNLASQEIGAAIATDPTNPTEFITGGWDGYRLNATIVDDKHMILATEAHNYSTFPFITLGVIFYKDTKEIIWTRPLP